MFNKRGELKQKLSPGLRKIASDSGWLSQMLRRGAGLLISVWVGRYLGPEWFDLENHAIA